MSELDRAPRKVQPLLSWVWSTMMILALIVAIGYAIFR
jgi:hypothetical protein